MKHFPIKRQKKLTFIILFNLSKYSCSFYKTPYIHDKKNRQTCKKFTNQSQLFVRHCDYSFILFYSFTPTNGAQRWVSRMSTQLQTGGLGFEAHLVKQRPVR